MSPTYNKDKCPLSPSGLHNSNFSRVTAKNIHSQGAKCQTFIMRQWKIYHQTQEAKPLDLSEVKIGLLIAEVQSLSCKNIEINK